MFSFVQLDMGTLIFFCFFSFAPVFVNVRVEWEGSPSPPQLQDYCANCIWTSQCIIYAPYRILAYSLVAEGHPFRCY